MSDTKSQKSSRECNAPDRLDPRVFDALFPAPPDVLPDLVGLESEGDEYSFLLETICGLTDDSQPVEQYDGTLGVTRAFVDAHQSPVAQVQWNDDLATHYTHPGNVNGARWGSGTMISPDLFLTCGHLFDQTGNGWTRPTTNGTTTTISPQEIATRMHLNFNYQVDASGTLRAEARFPITQLVEYRLGGVDMAICRIGGSPGNTYGFTPVATADVALNAMIAIIGHPAGRPKRIEAGPATGLVPGRLLCNDIDTLGGNSGSGILGPVGSLVGVHTNGGCNPQGTGSNFGVPIMTIRNVSPTLQSLNTATAPIPDRIVTSPRDDLIGTLASRDTNTIIDRIGTNPRDDLATLAWLDTTPRGDVIGTKVTIDNIITSPVSDNIITSPGRRRRDRRGRRLPAGAHRPRLARPGDQPGRRARPRRGRWPAAVRPAGRAPLRARGSGGHPQPRGVRGHARAVRGRPARGRGAVGRAQAGVHGRVRTLRRGVRPAGLT